MSNFPAASPLLPEVFALHGKWRASDDAVVCRNERRSWSEFVAGNHRFAHGLRAHGLNTGDRIGVFMSNSLEMLTVLFGSMAAGAVSVPLNTSVSDEAIAAMFADADIKALAVSEEYIERLEKLRSNLDGTIVWLTPKARAGWTTIEALSAGQPASLPDAKLTPDIALNIVYSSGTTGLPKGIMHTHRGRRDWAYDLCIALRYHGKARTLLTLGLYSNISWVAMLCTLLAGGTLVVHPRFDAAAFLETVASERITHTAMVPVQYQRVIEVQEQSPRNIASMQAMMSCGSPLHERLKKSLFRNFPCGVIELFGLTEGIITTLDPEDAEGRWASVGKPLIGTDICLIDDHNSLCAPNEPGEILSRGRITMPGYWNRASATEDARYVDPSGEVWIRSGDIGYLDSEGFLYVVDRKKDMILSGGQNIYPQDLESVLMRHPGVLEAAVVGAPSERWGETPVALVVLDDTHNDGEISTEEVLRWANERLGRQQRLTACKPIGELPRNANGKILKRELRKSVADEVWS
ncbi:MAG: class I adenylate-forming enzyme family protein [Pseudomonadota bacterium]